MSAREVWNFFRVLALIGAAPQLHAQDQIAATITPIVTGLDTPWGLALLPEGGILITEREGDLVFVANGQSHKVRDAPKVVAKGQGGLLDITPARDFASTREVFLTYSKPVRGGVQPRLPLRVCPMMQNASKIYVIFFKCRRARLVAGILAAAWWKRGMVPCF